MAVPIRERRSLLSSQALVQAPWIKVTIGTYTFGVFSNTKQQKKDHLGFYTEYNVQYPRLVKDLTIIKINGQVNQYTLTVEYPVRDTDDPNFFEKVLSSVSRTRKIVFSYGDSSMPNYVYKDEEAIITDVNSSFGFGSGGSASAVIRYTIKAVSGAALGKQGNFSFINSGKKKPSDEIKRLFRNKSYGLQDIFTGMKVADIDSFVAGDDKAVELQSKTNISPIDYINYLASCMIPAGTTQGGTAKDIYIMTLHDDTIYDRAYNDTLSVGGPYFKITRTSYVSEHSDAYEIDIGYNTAAIVTNFSIENNESYSILYDYQQQLYPEEYVRRLDNKGRWEDVYAPVATSKNENYRTTSADTSWWTKITKYPISATLTIQGLLRPATLMQYVRLNVIFTGGRKHISSGLYIVTQQTDSISEAGYRTTLKLTRISGD